MEGLSDSEKRRVEELLAALRTKLEVSINVQSPLMTDGFVSEFQSQLLAQHVFLGNPLFQESFETAFWNAAKFAGFSLETAPKGQRFRDLTVNGRRISLKSTKAKSIRTNSLHISKLTEAAWIQDCRSPSVRKEHTFSLFREYCSEVHEIIQLRYFQKADSYELVGLPVSLFQQILELPTSEFAADGPTINIPIGKLPPDFTLKLDRSDSKITIANINKDICTVHGTWAFPKS